MIGRHAEAHDDDRREEHLVAASQSRQADARARDEQGRGQDPAPRRAIGHVAEDRLDHRRGDVGHEHEDADLRIGQPVGALRERQHRRQRALIDVDDEMPEREQPDQPGVGADAPRGAKEQRGSGGRGEDRRSRFCHNQAMVH